MKAKIPTTILVLAVCIFVLLLPTQQRWTEEEAWKWYNKTDWSAGVNYVPAYAVNVLQMWQSWNASAIHQQLRWAKSIGFTKFRIFLHIEHYRDFKDELFKRIFVMLSLLKGNQAQAILVLFDDCWNAVYKLHDQEDPIPGVHNSRWAQCPGQIEWQPSTIKGYVTQTIKAFAGNQNIAMWDLYNEVGNSGHTSKQRYNFLKQIFQYARDANPTQPLTSCVWNESPQFAGFNEFVLSQSDIITFHAYCDYECTKAWIQRMKKYNRPVVCTEYMARAMNSKFITHLPLFKEEGVWAINWGFVFGRIQTYFPWGSKQGSPVPQIWFHDVVHPNGQPFDPKQTDFIRNITNNQILKEK